MPVTATIDSYYCTCLGHLGRHDMDRIISIGQGKYSSDSRMLLSLTFSHTNFANVHEPLGWTSKHLQSVAIFITTSVLNLVTPKAAAKRELFFNKQASEVGLLNKSTHLAAALGMTKFLTISGMNLVAHCCVAYVWPRCSTKEPQRPVFWTSKVDLSSITKCDLIHGKARWFLIWSHFNEAATSLSFCSIR